MNIVPNLSKQRLFLPVLLLFVFSVLRHDFLSQGNVYALLQAFALLAIATLGISITMVAGEFDLSIGAVAAVAGLVLVRTGESHPVLGIAFALAAGVCVGLANGVITRSLRVSSLVTTLGSMILLNGLAVWIEGGKVLSYSNFEEADILDDVIAGVFSIRSLLAVFCFVLCAGALSYTKIGRDIRASGSNRRAADMAGSNVSLALYSAFALSGFLAALSGALTSISLSTASSRFGGDLVLQAATAAIVGGVTLSGGVGTPFGIACGVLTLTILNNGLSLLGQSSSAILLLNGTLLLVVLVADRGGDVPRRLPILTRSKTRP